MYISSVKYEDPDELPDSQEMKRYRTSDSTVQIVVLLSISGSLRVLMSPLDGFRHCFLFHPTVAAHRTLLSGRAGVQFTAGGVWSGFRRLLQLPRSVDLNWNTAGEHYHNCTFHILIFKHDLFNYYFQEC